MKILVVVKRVIDYNVQIRVKEDGSGVHTDNAKIDVKRRDPVVDPPYRVSLE